MSLVLDDEFVREYVLRSSTFESHCETASDVDRLYLLGRNFPLRHTKEELYKNRVRARKLVVAESTARVATAKRNIASAALTI